MSTLVVDSLKLNLGRSPVLADVSLRLEAGEFISVLGPSGAGKSTLFRILTGILSPDEGNIVFSGRPLTENRQVFAYMPQSDALMPWRRLVDNVTLGLEIRGLPRKTARSLVRPHFAEFGLAGFERHYPSQLSGGMRQRAALLRTVVQNRPVLLLDEPFGALDALTRMQMQGWLETQRKASPWTTVLITHDVREAVALSDRIYVLSSRPARTICEVAVPVPRPRLTHAPSDCLRAIEADLLEILTVETGEHQ